MNSEEKLTRIVEVLEDKLTTDIVALKMGDLLYVSEWFVVATVQSEAQMRAVANHLQKVGKEEGFKPDHVEGLEGLRWALLDFSDIIVHIFQPEERALYDLEKLWFQAEKRYFGTQSTKVETVTEGGQE
jgi:ribosome-associated protein